MTATFEVMAEIDATGFFEDESVNWRWCVEHATFTHKDACEFIVHAGTGETSMVEGIIASMQKFGCTADFITAYREAAAAGAVRALFYA